MNNFTLYDPNNDSPLSLLNQIISSIDGIEINANSVNFIGNEQSTSFFDAINFGQGITLNQTGILLTSGNGTPPLLNTESAYSVDLGFPGDSQLTAIVQNAFGGAGETFDSSVLEFSFTRTNSSVNSILIDIIFGSEEFPNFINSSFVDIGAVIVNDRNYALIDGDLNKPLSVISATVEDGRFTDNTNGILPIEYNGITQRLVIPIPLEEGVDDYSVRIGIADTGDGIYDSGLFVSNFRTSTTNIGEVPLTVVEAPSLPFQIDHGFLELLSKVLVYEDWASDPLKYELELQNSQYNTQNLSYTLNKVWDDKSTGFYAIGLTAENAPPILVIRGTGDPLDFLDDANPSGIGFTQFNNNRDVNNPDGIFQWLISQDRNFAPYITGHSLGGALSQWFASYITDVTDDLPLGEVVTFNSPGISPSINFQGNNYGTSLFQLSEVDGVTHYVTSADIVSLAGLTYIPGDVRFFDYSALPNILNLFPSTHLTPILGLGEDKISDGTLSSIPFSFLNSPLFNYSSDLDHVILQFAISKFFVPLGSTIAASLSSRFGTETLRTTTGLLIDLADFLANLGQDGLEILQSAVIAIGNGGAAALEAIADWGIDAFEAVSSWTADTWNKASSWTGNTWSATVDFTVDNWNTVTEALKDVAFEAGKFVINKTLDYFLPNLSPLLPFQVFSQTLSETTAMGVGAENTNSTVIEVSINISQPSEDVISLDYATVNGSAIEGEDYVASSGTITFQPGETEKLIPIEVLGLDTWQEGKTLSVQLSNPLNVLLLLDDQITVTINPNNAPILLNPIENQEGAINEFLDFQIPDDTFADQDQELGDTLTYSATLADGIDLPSWLIFDPINLIFSGLPKNINIDNLAVIVTATDEAQESVSAEFILNIIVPEENLVLPAGVNTATLFEDNEGNNAFQGSTAPDVYNLTPGSSNVIQGTLEQLNQDIVFNFESNDVILVKNVQFTANQLIVTLGSAILEIDSDGNGETDATIILEGDYSNGVFMVETLLNDTKIVFNTPPTGVNLTSIITELQENTAIGEGIKVADIAIVDDALGDNLLSLTGADADSFEIRGNELFYIDESPNFESKNQYEVTLNVQDLSLGEDVFASSDFTLTILDVNESSSITSVNVFTLPENTTTVATITATDPDVGDVLTYSITGGADADLFEINSETGALSFKEAPDFENPLDDGGNNIYDLEVTVTDQGDLTAQQSIEVTVTDVNEAPTAVNLSNTITELAENTEVGTGIKVADITIIDDALGTNELSLTGVDVDSFEIIGTELFYIGESPDFETKNQYQVTVNVDDDTVGDTPDATVNFTLAITDVNEAPIVNQPIADQTAQEANVFSLIIPEDTFIDPEADTLFYSASLEDGTTPLPSWLNFDIETLTFSGTPSSDDVGNLTVGVFANDGFLTTFELFTISIEPMPNNPPTITSPNTFTIPENSNIVGNITATDPNEGDVLTYSITGGVDATFFDINPETGALSFKEAPDFENPLDDGGNNIYVLEVTVTDQGDLTARQSIEVTVTNVNEVAFDGRVIVYASSFSDGEIIIPPNPDTASRFIGDDRNNIFEPSTASDYFDLTSGGANTIQGTLSQLNGDIIEGFDRTDKIIIQGSVFSADQLQVTFSSAILEIDSNNDGNTDATITLEGDFSNALFIVNQGENSTEISYDILNTSINRFRHQDTVGGYLFAGEEESQSIRDNYPNFIEEGFAFKVATQGGDSLMRINRFQNQDIPGAYLFAGEEESQSIRDNYPMFVEEGIAFYAAAPGSSTGESIYRFQSLINPGSYIFVGETERQSIFENYSHAFVEEGIAFELLA
ncbi:putative Ig domain-containing protein [Geminocystis sp. CENA526]|uniref:putative Ig domain-containing protein n=1 Tax=Geminocystis sp. CENA526 TaxID=1355871 RepID=UPI003D6DB14B